MTLAVIQAAARMRGKRRKIERELKRKRKRKRKNSKRRLWKNSEKKGLSLNRKSLGGYKMYLKEIAINDLI